MEIQRWLALMARLGLPPSRDEFNRLVQAYTAADRHYHNAEHIARCLAELDAAAPGIPQPDPIELAIWFHDAVYDTRSASNEADSAAWAADFLHRAQAAPQLTESVVALILATRHQPGALAVPEQWMVDIDLSSLGADPERWTADNQAIRREYAWVPEAIFREKRLAILRSFLERPAIYATPYFRGKYEAQARVNLTETIRQLEELSVGSGERESDALS
jgi:predicted metal-dependent HD superfamily phosphohydrolase